MLLLQFFCNDTFLYIFFETVFNFFIAIIFLILVNNLTEKYNDFLHNMYYIVFTLNFSNFATN